MIRRILASLFFLAGGYGVWFLFKFLNWKTSMYAGMSSGPVPEAPASESFLPLLMCSYFGVSAAAILLIRRRTALRKAAIIAHLPLLLSFCVFVSEALDRGIGTFLVVTVLSGLGCVILF